MTAHAQQLEVCPCNIKVGETVTVIATTDDNTRPPAVGYRLRLDSVRISRDYTFDEVKKSDGRVEIPFTNTSSILVLGTDNVWWLYSREKNNWYSTHLNGAPPLNSIALPSVEGECAQRWTFGPEGETLRNGENAGGLGSQYVCIPPRLGLFALQIGVFSETQELLSDGLIIRAEPGIAKVEIQ